MRANMQGAAFFDQRVLRNGFLILGVGDDYLARIDVDAVQAAFAKSLSNDCA
jgi:hypothetical protein